MRRSMARIAGQALLLVRRDGVDVGGVRAVRQVGARAARLVDQPLEQEMRPLRTFVLQHRIERVQPLPRFLGVCVVSFVHL